MVLLVVLIKCETIGLRLIFNILCVGCSVLCSSVTVYVVFGVADNLCSSSISAIWAPCIAALPYLSTESSVRREFRLIALVLRLGGSFTGINPAFSSPFGRCPPKCRRKPLAVPHVRAFSPVLTMSGYSTFMQFSEAFGKVGFTKGY